MKVSEYIRRRSALDYTPFIIKSDGQGFYIVDGVEVPSVEFRKKHELPMSLFSFDPDKNIDSSKTWLQNRNN